MRMVIVTVNYQTERGDRSYDLEIPCTIPTSVLTGQICSALHDYTGKQISCTSVFCARLGRSLRQEETFDEAGIWNGDILELK